MQSGYDSSDTSGGSYTSRLFTTFYYVAGFAGCPVCAVILYSVIKTSLVSKSALGTHQLRRRHWWNLGAFLVLNVLSAAAYIGCQVRLRTAPWRSGVAYLPEFQALTAVTEILILVGSVTAVVLSSRALSHSPHVASGPRLLRRRERRLVGVAAVLLSMQSLWTAVESVMLDLLAPLDWQGWRGYLVVSRLASHTVAWGVAYYLLNFVALVLLYAAAHGSDFGLWPRRSVSRDDEARHDMVQAAAIVASSTGVTAPEVDTRSQAQRDQDAKFGPGLTVESTRFQELESVEQQQQHFELSGGRVGLVSAVELGSHQNNQFQQQPVDRQELGPGQAWGQNHHYYPSQYHQPHLGNAHAQVTELDAGRVSR